MAGLRLTDDLRNKLFLDFVDIVSRIKPKVIVFENVEGLLSFQNGRTYMTIHNISTKAKGHPYGCPFFGDKRDNGGSVTLHPFRATDSAIFPSSDNRFPK